MVNLVSAGLTERIVPFNQETPPVTDGASRKDEPDDGDHHGHIGNDRLFERPQSFAKKDGSGADGLLGLLAKLFSQAGHKQPEAAGPRPATEFRTVNRLPVTQDKPVCDFQPPVAEVKAEPAPPPPPPASEKSGKPVEGEHKPDSDDRSADQIINDNPVLKNLGNQKDIQRGKLKDLCGDWTDANKDPKSRADAAWKMAHVLNYIDNSKDSKGNPLDNAGKGDITGLTKGGDARHGTKAGLLKDFGDKGYSAIKDDQQLDVTKDSHVRPNGTNKDNFQWACGQAGKVLKYIVPGLGNVLVGVGDSEGGVGGVFKGAFKGVVKTWKNDLNGLKDAITKGRISPAQIAVSMYKSNIEGAIKDDAKAKAKDEVKNRA